MSYRVENAILPEREYRMGDLYIVPGKSRAFGPVAWGVCELVIPWGGYTVIETYRALGVFNSVVLIRTGVRKLEDA